VVTARSRSELLREVEDDGFQGRPERLRVVAFAGERKQRLERQAETAIVDQSEAVDGVHVAEVRHDGCASRERTDDAEDGAEPSVELDNQRPSVHSGHAYVGAAVGPPRLGRRLSERVASDELVAVRHGQPVERTASRENQSWPSGWDDCVSSTTRDRACPDWLAEPAPARLQSPVVVLRAH
jgi:hypothetical protein